MAAKRWIRLHTELLNSKKVQTLAPHLFKILINIWCIAAEKDGVLPEADDFEWRLKQTGLTASSAKTAISSLLDKGFLDRDGDVITVHDFSYWQFFEKAGASTERSRRFRERLELQKAASAPAASEAAPAADSEWAAAAISRHPKKTDRVLAEHALCELAAAPGFDPAAFDDVHRAWCATDQWREQNGRFAPKLANWIEDRGYACHPEAGGGGAVDGGNLAECLSDYPEIRPVQIPGGAV